MSHLLDCSGLLDSGGRASPLGRPHPVSYPVSKQDIRCPGSTCCSQIRCVLCVIYQQTFSVSPKRLDMCRPNVSSNVLSHIVVLR